MFPASFWMAAMAALASAAAKEAASLSQQPLDLEFATTMRQVELALSSLGGGVV